MMAGIRGGNTRPERRLRSALHARGFRYRLHVRGLPGRPDLVFPRYNAVVFVHGCFWHRHKGCRFTTTPTTRPDFWAEKFTANVARDELQRRELLALGWRVAVIWECALRKPDIDERVDELSEWLTAGGNKLELSEPAETVM